MVNEIDQALAALRPGLAADGFDLRCESVAADGAVTVVLEAKPDACTDCLVPDALLYSMLERAIRPGYPALTRVVLKKLNFPDDH